MDEDERTRFIYTFVPVDWARDLLAVLADKPKRPADLRRELGVSSPLPPPPGPRWTTATALSSWSQTAAEQTTSGCMCFA